MSAQTFVEKLPKCDFCAAEGESIDARYDGRTVLGSWANMCIRCFGQYGTGLGTGCGQELLVKALDAVEEEPGFFTVGAMLAYQQGVTFTGWMDKISRAIGSSLGLSLLDLPDRPYRDWFEGGVSPREAVEQILEGEMLDLW